jgi:23S rRNA (pseudouridine1915-N3)-methyltransferase
MRITILAVGTRMQPWVYEAVEVYRRRLPSQIQLQVTEVPSGKRTTRSNVAAAMEKEAEQLLKLARPADLTVALDESGAMQSSVELAGEMEAWLQGTPHVALLIGGPDGLTAECKAFAARSWSLSRLTLPHGLVRVVLAEQIYRAWTILQGHPYHRS